MNGNRTSWRSRAAASLGVAVLTALCAAHGGSEERPPGASPAAAADQPVHPVLADLVAKPPGAPAGAAGAKKAAPAAKAAAKKAPVRKPAPKAPLNAAYTRGLYTVAKQGTGVYYRKGLVLKVGVNVIEADLSNPEVRVAAMVSRGGIGTAERFGQMVRHAGPTAAITGTFFGIRNRIPTGDLVINGQAVFRGFIGTAVAITEGNVVSFIKTRYKDQSVDWRLFDTVIRGGPRLVDQGVVTMTARSEGFRTLPVSARRTRTAVGLTRDNRLQLVAVRQGITLWELAKVMRAIGAYHAVALDGGTSTAMYFAGQYIARPGRTLTNVLLIYHRKAQFEAMRDRFGAPYVPRPDRHAALGGAPEAPGAPAAAGSGFQPAQGIDFPVLPRPEASEMPPAPEPPAAQK